MTGFQNFRVGDSQQVALESSKELAPNLKRVRALFMPDAKAHASFLDAAKRGRAISWNNTWL